MTKTIQSYTAHVQTGILLNANESSVNLPLSYLDEIQEAVSSLLLNRYPDTNQTQLLQAYSRVCGVSSQQLLAGNGSDQMLGLLISAFLGKGKTLYTFAPDFSMYDYYASAYEADIRKYALQPDGTLDIPKFIEEGKGVDLVMFSNPNNPTGNCLSVSEIQEILEGFQGTPVVVDEAYMEFADETSAMALVDTYDNLYVTRTLSKAYALAGIRVGFLISSAKNMEKMKQAAVPYALNSISMKVAEIVLSHDEDIKKNIEEIKKERQRMYEAAKKLHTITFYPSQGNFLYGTCSDPQGLLQLFAQAGIIIRSYDGTDTFRISIGSAKENDLVLSVLKKYEEVH